MNKKVKKISSGVLIFFAGIGMGQTYKLIKDTKQPVTNIKKQIEEKIDELTNNENVHKFLNPKKQTKPSATNSKNIEKVGKSVDKFFGNNKSWNETSGIDTYGESLSGTLDAMATGQYVTQKPSNKEMKEFIDSDMKNLNNKIKLIKNNSKLGYFENLEKIVSIYFVGDYNTDLARQSISYIKNNYDFIINKDKYHHRDITFEDMDYKTELYFINSTIKMDNELTKILPNYKYTFENSIYKDMDILLSKISNYMLKNGNKGLKEYKQNITEIYNKNNSKHI